MIYLLYCTINRVGPKNGNRRSTYFVNIFIIVGDISLSFDFALLSMSSRPKPAVNKLKAEDQNHFFVYLF